MHAYQIPALVLERVEQRMGKLLANSEIVGSRAALVVIDMQNYFCAPGFPAEVPLAREIVPNINRVARSMRRAGGAVVWVQTTAAGAIQHWANYQRQMLTPRRQKERLIHLDGQSEGFKLFPTLEVLTEDLRITKIMYSAFIQGSSDIDAQLKARDISLILVAGTLTNVCCESSARDAMMLGYNVIMLSDASATLTDEEHAAALNTFSMFFGDVMTTGEIIARVSGSSHPSNTSCNQPQATR
jgi:ureidoacrylate peracid hydrolase